MNNIDNVVPRSLLLHVGAPDQLGAKVEVLPVHTFFVKTMDGLDNKFAGYPTTDHQY